VHLHGVHPVVALDDVSWILMIGNVDVAAA
jgi:hypothetical protein